MQVRDGRRASMNHNAGDYTHSRGQAEFPHKTLFMRSYASNLHYGERRRVWQWVQAAVPGGVGLSIVCR
ncbi:hypothetical protein GCM10007905_29730 [Mixta theicola]|nr:hypothetical protein GCM10007905_29730 [Mixta theicola]